MLPLVLACILLRFVGYLTTHLAVRLLFVAAAFGWSVFGTAGGGVGVERMDRNVAMLQLLLVALMW